MKNVFIIGLKGIFVKYGGFEIFVEYLIKMKVSEEIVYYVFCMVEDNREFYYNNVCCFNVRVFNIGSVKVVLYDILSLKECLNYIKEKKFINLIVYVLVCWIGLFFVKYKRVFEKMGV